MCCWPGTALRPTSAGAKVRFEGERPTVIDGPFTEAKEIVAGYWIWECSSREEALEWLKRAPFGGGIEIELRPIFETEDFGEHLTPELRRPTGSCASTPCHGIAEVVDEPALHRTIDAVWRMESARLIAGLTRQVAELAVAEDLAQDALVAALEQWPETAFHRTRARG